MAFNIDSFRSNGLTFDGARPNLFQVNMVTTGLGIRNIDEKLTFLARSSSLPEDNIGMVSVPYFGRELKIAGNRTFGEWTVTVINDEDFLIRNAMELWMSGINSHVGNLRDRRYRTISGNGQNGSYTVDAAVTQYAKRGEVIKKYAFVGVWPMNISAIELDWASNDAVEEYSITFAYQWWEASSGTTDTTSSVLSSASVAPGGAQIETIA